MSSLFSDETKKRLEFDLVSVLIGLALDNAYYFPLCFGTNLLQVFDARYIQNYSEIKWMRQLPEKLLT